MLIWLYEKKKQQQQKKKKKKKKKKRLKNVYEYNILDDNDYEHLKLINIRKFCYRVMQTWLHTDWQKERYWLFLPTALTET